MWAAVGEVKKKQAVTGLVFFLSMVQQNQGHPWPTHLDMLNLLLGNVLICGEEGQTDGWGIRTLLRHIACQRNATI